jgi:predicted O-methyltransferase YrrM
MTFGSQAIHGVNPHMMHDRRPRKFKGPEDDRFDHFDQFSTYCHGPIQRDEAMFLYSLVKMIRPQTIVEFGLQSGISAYNFILAKDDFCHYYGFDIEDWCIKNAEELCHGQPNTRFIQINCLDFDPSHIDHRKIDIVFLDCAHDVQINQKTIERIMPCMDDEGLLVIHDTGIFSAESRQYFPIDYREKFPRAWERWSNSNKDEFVLVEERHTVNWFKETYPEHEQLHLHSKIYFRCGMTIFQKKRRLTV